jgi:hypothetical protein
MEMIELVVTDKQVDQSTCWKVKLLFVVDNVGLGNDLLATVKTVRRYAMPQVRFTGCRINRQGRLLQLVV